MRPYQDGEGKEKEEEKEKGEEERRGEVENRNNLRTSTAMTGPSSLKKYLTHANYPFKIHSSVIT